MSFDVFISYPHKNKVAADATCAALEADGIRCWIAPRDVAAGAEWAASIVDAISRCRVMVLIFSEHANQSKQIHREVQQAFDNELPVVPLRVENAMPTEALAYYMGPIHWLDALTPPLESHLKRLSVAVRALLDAKGSQAPERFIRRNSKLPGKQRSILFWIGVTVSIFWVFIWASNAFTRIVANQGGFWSFGSNAAIIALPPLVVGWCVPIILWMLNSDGPLSRNNFWKAYGVLVLAQSLAVGLISEHGYFEDMYLFTDAVLVVSLIPAINLARKRADDIGKGLGTKILGCVAMALTSSSWVVLQFLYWVGAGDHQKVVFGNVSPTTMMVLLATALPFVIFLGAARGSADRV
jgi:uncharacterized membrane protein YhaH (DUF805 family)